MGTNAPIGGPWDTPAGAYCPVCGAYGYHNCLGPRPAMTVNLMPDWNRLIVAVERLVNVLEKLVPPAHIDGSDA